jgi:hypothetical protein
MREPIIVDDIIFNEFNQLDVGRKSKIDLIRKNINNFPNESERMLFRYCMKELGILFNTKYEKFVFPQSYKKIQVSRSSKWDLFVVMDNSDILVEKDRIMISDIDEQIFIPALDGRIILCNNTICIDFHTDKKIAMFRGLDL